MSRRDASVGGFPLAPPSTAVSYNTIERYSAHRQRVLTFYDAFSGDIAHAPSFHLGYEAASRWIFRVARHHCDTPPERIVDLCCGVGGSARARAMPYPAATVGVDISLRQLLMAQRLNAVSPLRLLFCAADAQSLPFRSRIADLIMSEDALAHCDDRAAVLAETFRILRVGGLLLITDVIIRNGLSERAMREMREAWAIAPLETLESYEKLVRCAGLEVLRLDYIAEKLLRAQSRWDRRHGAASYEQHLATLRANEAEFSAAWGRDAFRARAARLQTFLDLQTRALDYALVVARRPAAR